MTRADICQQGLISFDGWLSAFCLAICVFAVTLFCGCGGEPRYRLEGSVTWQGQPVPLGEIALESQGDGNRAIVAPIRDGRYRFDDDRGHSGGRYRVRIVHIPDSNEATGVVEPLWFDPWQDRIDLPAEHVERDFKLPNPERASRLR